MKYQFLVLSFLLMVGPLKVPAQVKHNPPNIVIFLADDMGYSDITCFGGEVRTPNLDNLAHNGLRYTQFYNTARCWPSRAAILTGYYAQQVRRDTIPGVPNTGGGGIRPEWARLLPELLKAGGYRTYHSGKWHLDGKALENGFDHSYTIIDTDRHFNPQQHLLDDVPLPPVPPNTGYYSTTAIANHAIDYLKDHQKNYNEKPFFEYVAFICPHFPVMAPPNDIERYRTRYSDGWDKLRLDRLKRMKKLGILNCKLSERTPGVPAWITLSTEVQKKWSDTMAVHAAMVDRMDREIGRVINQIKRMHQLDNTLILFLSDNGASAEIVDRGDGNHPGAEPGSAESFLCIEPGWANLANSPLRKSKIFVHEGGISTPLIVQWPNGIKDKNSFRRIPGHIIDITPTLLEIAGVSRSTSINESGAPPMPGISIASSFASEPANLHKTLWWFHEGNRAIRQGDWKLVSAGMKSPWELYNIADDRSETRDLSSIRPDLVKSMSEQWQQMLDQYTRDATEPKTARE